MVFDHLHHRPPLPLHLLPASSSSRKQRGTGRTPSPGRNGTIEHGGWHTCDAQSPTGVHSSHSERRGRAPKPECTAPC